MAQLLQYYKSFQNSKSSSSAPTFEDLSIDDALPELDRVVRYVKSSIGLQRLVHVKMLAAVARAEGLVSTCDHIVPVLEQLSVDFEPAIRSHLCEQMASLAAFIAETGDEAGYQIILDVILPTIAQLLEDGKVEVRQAASVALVSVAQIIKAPDLGQHVLTIILQLAHEDENEEMRMTASELLNLLAEHLGLDLCKQFVIPEVVSLAEDPVFRVRKSTALNFENVCKVGGEHELFERLMPAFVRLSKDDMYRVRRACAENLCEISKHVSNDIRTGVLVEIFLRLAQDPSKLVKQSILQQSGMFIATLPPRAISTVILRHFCNMVNNPTGDLSVDTELKHYCAYSFPGVLQTVGVERWSELREVYHSLVQSHNSNVKQTLAMSLHEIANILGEKLAEEELVAVFEEMIQEDAETVRLGIVKHLADFLRLLSMPCRVSYLPLLDDILQSTSPFNWRLRQSLASQLPELVTLPPPQNVFSTLFPLAMTLLQDPVAEVRIETFKGISKMILVLQPGGMHSVATGDDVEESDGNIKISPTESESEQYLDAIARAINALVYGETFMHRGLWAELCLQLLRDLPRSLFEHYFIDGIVKLTSDSVSNVRICVAQLLTGWSPTHPSPLDPDSTVDNCPWVWLLDKTEVKDCFRRLAKDDNDVYVALSKVSERFPELEFESFSCRGLKRAPGESVSWVSQSLGEQDEDTGLCKVSTVASVSSTDGVDDMEVKDYEVLSDDTESFTLLSLNEEEQHVLEDSHSLVDDVDGTPAVKVIAVDEIDLCEGGIVGASGVEIDSGDVLTADEVLATDDNQQDDVKEVVQQDDVKEVVQQDDDTIQDEVSEHNANEQDNEVLSDVRNDENDEEKVEETSLASTVVNESEESENLVSSDASSTES